MIGEDVKRYIIDFLIGAVGQRGRNTKKYSRRFELIGYTSDPKEMAKYPIVIKPSRFFESNVYGTLAAEPILPLAEWRGIPLLFGSPQEEELGESQTLVIHADLIASSYYLMSRYEEMTKRDIRDEHGRFPGEASLAFRAGFLGRPIIDEYGARLREIIRQRGLLERYDLALEARPETFSKVNLTHDVDRPYLYHGFRSFLRACLRERKGLAKALRWSFAPVCNDPYYTFPKLLEWNQQLRESVGETKVQSIFFLKTPSEHPNDKPNYLFKRGLRRSLLASLKRYKAKVGLHVSYEAGLSPNKIQREKDLLQHFIPWQPIVASRHHFLSLREPEDLIKLRHAGIRHDFTMGFADIIGFRLGTCRPVQFINPNARGLTDIVMHPLYVMDYTLIAKRYMALSLEEAERQVFSLIDIVAKYHGELNLLWHNECLSTEIEVPWAGRLYKHILRYIAEVAKRSGVDG